LVSKQELRERKHPTEGERIALATMIRDSMEKLNQLTPGELGTITNGWKSSASVEMKKWSLSGFFTGMA
jgi:hypothetical protein